MEALQEQLQQQNEELQQVHREQENVTVTQVIENDLESQSRGADSSSHIVEANQCTKMVAVKAKQVQQRIQ